MSNSDTMNLVDRITATAARYPDHIALQDATGHYTYAELLHYSHAIAGHLLQQGTTAGDRIVLLLDQGKAAVAAMLGVLAAGARFVPIDVKEPAERLRFILDDCQPRAILTDSANIDTFSASLPGYRLFNIDSIDNSDAAGSTTDRLPAPDGDSPAYIFYTSGSTGNPKGVCQNHRNVLHFASTYATTLGISHADRLSMLYSMNFSASNMDIFAGLLRGATVCFYDLKNRGSAGLEQWLESEQISVLHTVPSVFRHLLHSTTPGHVYRQVRAIDLGGEAVYNSDIPLIKTFFTPECLCFNHLAATEASVIAQHLIDTGRTYTRGLLPVGPAAAGITVRITNPAGNAAAVDETGEIILESEFLSTGYWNLPEQTATAFGTTPDGQRYYRSGDLGFFDSHGDLNYVGRNDFRVKINGQTIELGEIEACLLGIPGIDEAVAMAWQADAGSEKRLVAFYLAEAGPFPAAELRARLQQSLPAYMIPAHLIHRPAFPLTSTGKIDRKQLQPQAGEARLDATVMEPPQTPMEKHVAQIFASILKTAALDRHLTFFELGGNSLQAMNLVMLLEKNYRVDIPLELVNRNASIACIASHLESEIAAAKDHAPTRPAAPEPLLMPLVLNAQPLKLFLIHGRDGHAMISPHLGQLLSARHSLYVIRARGLKHGERPHLSIEGMAAEYIHEIRKVQPQGPYYLAGLCAGSIIALEMARQLKRVGEVVKPVIVFDPPIRSATPMPLEKKRELLRDMHRQLQEYRLDDYQDLARGLEKRIRDGKIDIDLSDEHTLGATAHVVIGMNIAMNTYQPHHPYQGEVIILCSKERFENKRRFGDVLISGRLHHFIVGQTHDDVLDARNPHFIDALQKSLAMMTRVQA